VSAATESDDVRLVEAARNGDRGAFGDLYMRYARMVHGIVLARVTRCDAEDLVHDVFLHAMGRLDTLRDSQAFGAWLAAIARNRAVDHARRALQVTDLPEDLEATQGNHAEAMVVLDVIRTLPEAYRETLVLRLVEGLTGPEGAAATGLTPASVRVNLHRGMHRLREKLARSEHLSHRERSPEARVRGADTHD
jgi:RNA polymerase sigma-70 factor (ECF subfamily)